MRAPTTHWKLSVRFDSHAYSVESRRDVDLTPADMLEAIEDFAARLRRDIATKATKREPPQ